MSGQGGPHPWADTVVTNGSTSVVITDSEVVVTVSTKDGAKVTRIDRKTGASY